MVTTQCITAKKKKSLQQKHTKNPQTNKTTKKCPPYKGCLFWALPFIPLYAFPLPGFTFYESFAAMANLLQVKLIKMKLLSLLTHGKFHELQFV